MSKPIRSWFVVIGSVTMISGLIFANHAPALLAQTTGTAPDSAPTALAPARKATESVAIRKVIEGQRDAWNRHDLETFMAGYWNSPELTFFSGGREYDGWQASLDRYKTNYQGTGHEMGQLDFRNLRIEMLGPDAALARGEYHLTMADGKTPHGLFTLVFRKFPDGWKIVHDHSAAE